MRFRLFSPAKQPEWLPQYSLSIQRWFRELDRPAAFTVATLPDAAENTGRQVFVSDESGGAVIAFSDGADWRRCTDRAVVS